jgi:hypothetical protein
VTNISLEGNNEERRIYSKTDRRLCCSAVALGMKRRDVAYYTLHVSVVVVVVVVVIIIIIIIIKDDNGVRCAAGQNCVM